MPAGGRGGFAAVDRFSRTEGDAPGKNRTCARGLGTHSNQSRIRVRRVGRKPRKISPPTPQQVRAVLQSASPSARPPILLAATAGLRRGEVFALRWDDLDFEGQTIRVRETNHGGGVITATKTSAGQRLVPMFESLRPVLLERRGSSRFNRPHDLVFATELGTPESPNGWLKQKSIQPLITRTWVVPIPRPPSLCGFAAHRAGGEHPAGCSGGRPCRSERHVAGLLAPDGGWPG